MVLRRAGDVAVGAGAVLVVKAAAARVGGAVAAAAEAILQSVRGGTGVVMQGVIWVVT